MQPQYRAHSNAVLNGSRSAAKSSEHRGHIIKTVDQDAVVPGSGPPLAISTANLPSGTSPAAPDAHLDDELLLALQAGAGVCR